MNNEYKKKFYLKNEMSEVMRGCFVLLRIFFLQNVDGRMKNGQVCNRKHF